MSGEPHVRIDRGRLAEPRLPKPDERETFGPALGAWGTQPTPSQPPTSPRIKNLTTRPSSSSVIARLRACWVTQLGHPVQVPLCVDRVGRHRGQAFARVRFASLGSDGCRGGGQYRPSTRSDRRRPTTPSDTVGGSPSARGPDRIPYHRRRRRGWLRREDWGWRGLLLGFGSLGD